MYERLPTEEVLFGLVVAVLSYVVFLSSSVSPIIVLDNYFSVQVRKVTYRLDKKIYCKSFFIILERIWIYAMSGFFGFYDSVLQFYSTP